MKKFLTILFATVLSVAFVTFLSSNVLHAEEGSGSNDDDVVVTHLDLGIDTSAEEDANKAAEDAAKKAAEDAAKKAAEDAAKKAAEDAAKKAAEDAASAQGTESTKADANDVDLGYKAGGVKKGGTLKKVDQPKNDPPKNDQPKNDPPKNDQPKNDPPKNDQPKNDPPKNEAPRRASFNPPLTGDVVWPFLQNVRKSHIIALALVGILIFFKKRS